MTNTGVTITIIAVLIIGFCVGAIADVRFGEEITKAECVTMCKDTITELQIDQNGSLINACRIICKENNTCKENCLNGTLIEAEI